MVETLRRLIRLGCIALLLGAVQPAAAECIHPLVTPTECDFKDERTQLWLNQPGWKLTEEKKFDTLIDAASQSIENYYATVKTTGDAAIRAQINALRDDIEQTLIVSVANEAVLRDNDPIDLKRYLDKTRCQRFWSTLFDEDCPRAWDMPVKLERLEKLRAVVERIEQIRTNPHLVLGEEWGEVADDIDRIKASYRSISTLGRNFDADARVAELRKRFPGYAQLLAREKLTLEQWRTERQNISATLNDTLRDTMISAHELAMTPGNQNDGTPRGRDYDELIATSGMNRNAIGRMQVMEIANMNKSQTAQAWLKISEQQLNLGNLMALDLADELYSESTGMAIDSRRLALDPENPTIVGNEAPLPFK